MKRFVNGKWAARLLIAILIALPILIGLFYRKSADALYRKLMLPDRIVILTGSEGGLYRKLGENLKAAIERELDIEVELPVTNGSLENLEKLRVGQAHFAMYQPGTLEALTDQTHHAGAAVATVANLYSQPAHLIVRRGAEISSPEDLVGKRVQLGMSDSGDSAMSSILLTHFGIKESEMEVLRLSYADMIQQFESDQLDAAIVCVGVQAPVFEDLYRSDRYHLLDIPYRDAVIAKNISLSPYTIPQGLYRSREPVEPDVNVNTVALGAQLLTRDDVPLTLVWEVTRLLTTEDFLKQNQLGELYQQGYDFAEQNPEFPIHPGAKSYYHPEFDVQVFEGWEALYSLAASFLIAAVFLYRTYRQRLERKKEHKLDRFIRKLLEIEQRQLDLDQSSGTDDCKALQQLLDDVTELRAQALREFTAHELNEDRAVDSFVEMSHALSNKINAKLSRQRFEQAISKLGETLRK